MGVAPRGRDSRALSGCAPCSVTVGPGGCRLLGRSRKGQRKAAGGSGHGPGLARSGARDRSGARVGAGRGQVQNASRSRTRRGAGRGLAEVRTGRGSSGVPLGRDRSVGRTRQAGAGKATSILGQRTSASTAAPFKQVRPFHCTSGQGNQVGMQDLVLLGLLGLRPRRL